MNGPQWVRRYVGIPFAECDCWQLVSRVYEEQYGISLPIPTYGLTRESREAAAQDQLANELWIEESQPEEGSILLFMTGGKLPHVGICIAPGAMLHVPRDKLSCVDRFTGPRWRGRFTGSYRPRTGT